MANFVVYKSGAGSGKTFTLVKEYIRLALSDEKKIRFNFKRILAVTFTNKAASEMKQRLIDNLSEICHEPVLPSIAFPLMKDLQIEENELRRRASILLTSLLHNYSELAIGTIDSFTHKIVKTFAHDLDLPVNFSVETDVSSFYEKVISELFSKVGEDKQITELLKEYALGKTDENASWDPERSIRQFVKLLQKEEAPEYTAKIQKLSDHDLDTIYQHIKQECSTFKKELRSLAEIGHKILTENRITSDQLFNKSNSASNIFRKVVENKYKTEDFAGKGLENAIRDNKWLAVSGSLDDQFTSAAKQLVEYFEKNNPTFLLNELLRKNMHLIRLIKKIEEISANRKEEDQIVFISEFNRKIFELINNEPAPFIYERLGEKYQHYLLDEFQDTSSLQWQNILPLIDHSLAAGWYNLIVGDGKQSIYRWRNANVKQFAELPGTISGHESPVQKERISALIRNFSEDYLNVNRRSTSTVVEFNNSLFEYLSKTLPGELNASIYKKQEQITESKAIGYVRVDAGKIPNDELDEVNLNKMVTHVQSSLSSGFEPRDICIITRKKEQGSMAANRLSVEGIPVVSSESLLLKNNKEVNALVHFLEYLADPGNKIAGAVVLEQLHHSKKINEETFLKSISELGSFDLFQILSSIGIHINKEQLLFSNLFDSCILISDLLDLNKSNQLYIRFFLDAVTEFILSGNNNASEFLDWWESKKEKASVIIPENSNAVKIMTIHASKGLEFPVVIIPFCNWQIHSQDETWIDLAHTNSELPVSILKISKQLETAGLNKAYQDEIREEVLDNLNLLYVAFTRAVERLYILSLRGEATTMVSVDQWINPYLNGLKGGELNVYELGNEQKPLPKKKKQEQSILVPDLLFNMSSNSVNIKSSQQIKENTYSSPIQKGIAIHEVLCRIRSKEDVLIETELAVSKGIIPRSEKDDLCHKINTIVDNPKLKEFYLADSVFKTEKEIITQDGVLLRPDRIAFSGNKAVVIDYKSGQINNSKYKAKMKEYCEALKELGYTEVQAFLAYVDHNEVVTLN